MSKEKVHIRHPVYNLKSWDNSKTLCGRRGGSISYQHCLENPTNHVYALENDIGLCDECCVKFIENRAKETK